jgi:CBS domain-containing protein
MRISDLCVCDVASCTRETSLARAGTLMRRLEVGTLPVVDRDDRVIGMITDRDIALELARRNAPASEVFVDEVMSDRVETVTADHDVREALRIMARHRIRRLPVVDADDRLEGIISIDDLFRHSMERGDGKGIDPEEVAEALLEITRDYQAEPAGREPRRASSENGGRYRRYHYREESPEFEGRAPRSRNPRSERRSSGPSRREGRAR